MVTPPPVAIKSFNDDIRELAKDLVEMTLDRGPKFVRPFWFDLEKLFRAELQVKCTLRKSNKVLPEESEVYQWILRRGMSKESAI